MSEYTPGPWMIDKGDWATECCVRSREGEIVADTVHTTAVEEKANLRLIAAAPDLLEACEALVDALEPFKHQNCEAFAGYPEYALKKGQEAIAKAKEQNG